MGLLEVARRLGVARGTVQARLAKLEARGVITGHGPEVDAEAMGYPISAFVFVELSQGRLREATTALEAIPEVLEADAISGPQDLVCRIARATPSTCRRSSTAAGDAGDQALHELHRAVAPGAAADGAARRRRG